MDSRKADSLEITETGQELTTTSAKTSEKEKDKARKKKFHTYFQKLNHRREREKGWEDKTYSSFKFKVPAGLNSSVVNEFIKKLEESEGFRVDGETRSFDISGFYRVYPYYDWDTAQIQDQKAILNHCCTVAVSRHNKRTGDDLVFTKLVSANMLRDGFPIYFITFKARREEHSRKYRTKVQYIRYHGVNDVAQAIINVHCFRPVKLFESTSSFCCMPRAFILHYSG